MEEVKKIIDPIINVCKHPIGKVMSKWEIAILKSVEQLGGEADNYEVYKKLPEFIELTKEHLRLTGHGDRPAFKHQVRRHLTNLRRSGDLKFVARGRNSLTISGKARIA